MELLVFGHGGARIVVFPTSQGRFYEWEDRGMVEALGDHIGNGWLQLYCVDSVDAASWYARWKHPEERARHQSRYERYVLEEVLPLSRRNANGFLMAACSGIPRHSRRPTRRRAGSSRSSWRPRASTVARRRPASRRSALRLRHRSGEFAGDPLAVLLLQRPDPIRIG